MFGKSNSTFGKIFNIISKILSWIIFAILLVAAVFLLYYFIAMKIYIAKGPGYEPKYSIYIIASPSMTPVINTYDAIINERVKSEKELKKGDIITFISTSILTPGMRITHRIVNETIDDEGNVCYETKGDFNPIKDQGCAKFKNIEGKVVMRIPQLGRIQKFLSTRFGWIFCILLPAIIIIGKDILKICNLTSVKSNVSSIDDSNKKMKQAKKEKERKEELKRKLLKENTDSDDYYEEPNIQRVDKHDLPKKKKK